MARKPKSGVIVDVTETTLTVKIGRKRYIIAIVPDASAAGRNGQMLVQLQNSRRRVLGHVPDEAVYRGGMAFKQMLEQKTGLPTNSACAQAIVGTIKSNRMIATAWRQHKHQ